MTGRFTFDPRDAYRERGERETDRHDWSHHSSASASTSRVESTQRLDGAAVEERDWENQSLFFL